MARKRSVAAALGGWSARHRKTAVFGWLVFVVAGDGGRWGGRPEESDRCAERGWFLGSGAADACRTRACPTRLRRWCWCTVPPRTLTPLRSGRLWTRSSPGCRAPARRRRYRALTPPGLISKDRHSALVVFDIVGDPDKAADHAQPILDAVAEVRAQHPGIKFDEFGDASGQKWLNESLGKDFKRAEWTAVPLAFGILLAAFGALIAAALPVLLAVTAFVAALGLLDLVSHSMPVASTSTSVMLLMGLAVGVDYCLFYLRRERQERAAGRSPQEALSVAAATSGHSVLVSGVTVMVAMAGMFLTGMHIFDGFALASILVVAIAMLGSVTVLPALLSMLGDRIDWGRRKSRRHRQARRRPARPAPPPRTAAGCGTPPWPRCSTTPSPSPPSPSVPWSSSPSPPWA